MSLLRRSVFSVLAGGFHSVPPSSRPPTKAYDRVSYVLVVHEHDDILKFLKMHLNRYFSHVVVAKSAADGVTFLKQKEFDLIIAEANPSKKTNAELIKKAAIHWRDVPIILTEKTAEPTVNPEYYSHNFVVNIVSEPLDMDKLHMAIRRALNTRALVKKLATAIPPKSAIGTVARSAGTVSLPPDIRSLVSEIQTKLNEEILD